MWSFLLPSPSICPIYFETIINVYVTSLSVRKIWVEAYTHIYNCHIFTSFVVTELKLIFPSEFFISYANLRAGEINFLILGKIWDNCETPFFTSIAHFNPILPDISIILFGFPTSSDFLVAYELTEDS